jgi:hypothetical protein
MVPWNDIDDQDCSDGSARASVGLRNYGLKLMQGAARAQQERQISRM